MTANLSSASIPQPVRILTILLILFCLAEIAESKETSDVKDLRILGEIPAAPAGMVIANLALATNGAVASSGHPFSYGGKLLNAQQAAMAIDGDIEKPNSRWISYNPEGEHWLTVDLGKAMTVFQINVFCDEKHGSFEEYGLQYLIDNTWKNIEYTESEEEANPARHRFAPLKTPKIRLLVTKGMSDGYARLYEMEIIGLKPDDPLKPIDIPEIFGMDFEVDGKVDLKDLDWRISAGDDMGWSRPDLDDQGWKSIRVGKSLFDQGFSSSGFYWYRMKFKAPRTFQDRTLLLDLGKISFYDEVFLNGRKIGTYSKHPPASPIMGSSFVYRKYLVDGALLIPDKQNLLAVRTYTGFAGGLYYGEYSLSALKGNLHVDFNLKGNGKDALLTFLTPSLHLNKFYSDEPIKISPRICGLQKNENEPTDYEAQIRVREQKGGTLFDKNIHFTADLLKWRELATIDLGTYKPGEYVCEFDVLKNNREIFKEKLPFVRDARSKYSMRVDPTLKARQLKGASRRNIAAEAMGNFGPRLRDQGTLTENLASADIRATLTTSAFVTDKEDAPLLFSCNVRPSHKRMLSNTDFTESGLNIYDGINDAWMLGRISTGQKSKTQKLEISKCTWAIKRYVYRYEDGSYLKFTLNSISPAFQIETDSRQIRIFDQIGKAGIGLPRKIAYLSPQGALIAEAAEGLTGKEMNANWLLVWFNGAEGWNEFDQPWLFILQKRPNRILTDAESLCLTYDEAGGIIFGLPLFGVTLLSPYSTGAFSNTMPEDIISKCRFWSRALLQYPVGVERDFSVEHREDALYLRDRFEYQKIEDEWHTPPLPLSPLPPVFALAGAANNTHITFDSQAFDTCVTTLYGPYLVVTNSVSLTAKIGGLVHFSGEVRKLIGQNTEKDGALKKELSDLARRYFEENNLSAHPWKHLPYSKYTHGDLTVGAAQPELTDLLLAVPYMDDEIGRKIKKETKKEIADYFLWSGNITEGMAGIVSWAYLDRPVLATIENPLTRLKFTTWNREKLFFGIDSVCWESLRLHTLGYYATFFDDWDLCADNWEFIKTFFNLIPNSHMWATGVTWDSFSGLRVGNGLQESGIIHAGACAMARMADKMKDPALRDYAVYFACLQALGMQAAVSSTSFLRERRPWLSSHTEAEEITEVERALEKTYVEFNEHGGFSQNIIFGLPNALSLSSYIMTRLPEIMRPYREIFGKETEYFFAPRNNISNPNLPAPSLDYYIYMLPEVDRDRIEENRRVRSANQKLKTIERITDLRAYLDHLGNVSYTNVFSLP